MIAISYKAQPRPQITLYSRTSYLGYIGALDLSVAWMCGKYIATALGIDVYGPIPADAVKVENGHWSAEPGTLAHAWIKAQFDIDWSRVDAEQIAKRQGYANIGIGMFAQDWCKFHGQQRNITRKSYLRL